MTNAAVTTPVTRPGTSAEALAAQRVLRELDGRVAQSSQSAKPAN